MTQKRIIFPPFGFDLTSEINADSDSQVFELLVCMSDDIRWKESIVKANHSERLRILKDNGFSIKKVKQRDVLKNIEKSLHKEFSIASENYPDIKILLEDLDKLKTQKNWTKEFLDGYLSCISDLILIKKML